MEEHHHSPLEGGVSHAELLGRVMAGLGAAWSGFQHPRPDQPPIDPRLDALLQEPLPERAAPVAAVLDDAMDVLDRSLAQPRPRYFGFVGGSGLEIAAAGDALAASFDVNLAVWAAAATRLEQQAVRWVASFVGFPAADGHFTSGGTISNITALAAARERAVPHVRIDGVAGRRLALYCSREAHHSVVRAAELLGIGSAGVRALPQDRERRLDPRAVAEAVDADRAAGTIPVAVVATGGTTLTGAVDPLDRLADVCAARDVWLHVDGAYGLPAAATDGAGDRFAGLARADSASVDAHKWLYLPKACGIVLLRDRRPLRETFSHEEAYMPHDPDQPNAVDATLEYSRPFRALKLWLAFRAHGASAFRAAVERNLRQAQAFHELVRGTPRLEAIGGPPPLSIVPYRHVPPGVADLDAHNDELVRRMQLDGRVYVASAIVDGRVAIRPCFVNYRTEDEDLRALAEVTCELGDALAAGRPAARPQPA